MEKTIEFDSNQPKKFEFGIDAIINKITVLLIADINKNIKFLEGEKKIQLDINNHRVIEDKLSSVGDNLILFDENIKVNSTTTLDLTTEDIFNTGNVEWNVLIKFDYKAI